MSEIKAFVEEQKRNLEREIGYRKRMINLAPKGSLVIRVRDSYRYLCHQLRDKDVQLMKRDLEGFLGITL